MVLVRIISADWWDDKRGRFSDVAFKRSGAASSYAESPDGYGGISVFDVECAVGDPEDGITTCGHIAHFYGEFYSEPVLYWLFEFDDLAPPDPNPNKFPDPILVAVPSETGDECHRNIHQLTPGRSDKLFVTLVNPPEETLRICDGADVPFSLERIQEIKQRLLAAEGLD